jgi:hypothetical protein
VKSLYVTTPPTLVAVDFHLIIHLSLSCKLHLARSSGCGSRHMTHLYESACASQDTLRPAVLEEHTNIDCGYHGPFSSFRFFYVETLKKAGEGGREVVKLDIGEEHPEREVQNAQVCRHWVLHYACTACNHNGRTDIHRWLQMGVWQSYCEKLKRINGDERKKPHSN